MSMRLKAGRLQRKSVMATMKRFITILFLTQLVTLVVSLPPRTTAAQAEQGTDEESASAALSPASASAPAPGAPVRKREWWERLELGSKLGLSLANFVGKDATSEVVEYPDKTRLTIGGLVGMNLSRWLSLQQELFFVSKGRDVASGGRVIDTFNANYIELPLLARIKIPLGGQVTPYLLAGPTLGVLLSLKLEDHVRGTITDRTELANRIDLGVLGGAGVSVTLSGRHALMIEGRYNRSLGTIVADESEDFKNRVFAFMLGYQYSLAPAVESAH